MVAYKILLCLLATLTTIFAAPQMPEVSDECLKLSKQCEDDTDCIHRLAVVQSACVTNTCQPQCRMAAMNLYQNRQGRNLLRSDASCVPGKSELEQCGFLPNKSPKHCNFAKLICEADLQCNSKWELFVSECEAETSIGQCSDKCRRHLNATLATTQGADFATCTCTDKDDQLCANLKGTILKACMDTPSSPTPSASSPAPAARSTTPRSRLSPSSPDRPASAPGASPLSILSLCLLFFVARILATASQ